MLDKGRFIQAAGGESVSSTPKMTIKQNAGEGNWSKQIISKL